MFASLGEAAVQRCPRLFIVLGFVGSGSLAEDGYPPLAAINAHGLHIRVFSWVCAFPDAAWFISEAPAQVDSFRHDRDPPGGSVCVAIGRRLRATSERRTVCADRPASATPFRRRPCRPTRRDCAGSDADQSKMMVRLSTTATLGLPISHRLRAGCSYHHELWIAIGCCSKRSETSPSSWHKGTRFGNSCQSAFSCGEIRILDP